jgi:hypothetical protein
MQEAAGHLLTKLPKPATLPGKTALKQAGLARRDAFARHLLESIITSHNPSLSS